MSLRDYMSNEMLYGSKDFQDYINKEESFKEMLEHFFNDEENIVHLWI